MKYYDCYITARDQKHYDLARLLADRVIATSESAKEIAIIQAESPSLTGEGVKEFPVRSQEACVWADLLYDEFTPCEDDKDWLELLKQYFIQSGDFMFAWDVSFDLMKHVYHSPEDAYPEAALGYADMARKEDDYDIAMILARFAKEMGGTSHLISEFEAIEDLYQLSEYAEFADDEGLYSVRETIRECMGHLLGDTDLDRLNYKKALKILREVNAGYPDIDECVTKDVNCDYWKKAVRHPALELNMSNAKICFDLARLLEFRGNYKESHGYYLRAKIFGETYLGRKMIELKQKAS